MHIRWKLNHKFKNKKKLRNIFLENFTHCVTHQSNRVIYQSHDSLGDTWKTETNNSCVREEKKKRERTEKRLLAARTTQNLSGHRIGRKKKKTRESEREKFNSSKEKNNRKSYSGFVGWCTMTSCLCRFLPLFSCLPARSDDDDAAAPIMWLFFFCSSSSNSRQVDGDFGVSKGDVVFFGAGVKLQ